MIRITDYPLLVLVISFASLYLAVWSGATRFTKWRRPDVSGREDFNLVLSATLTLLGLIVGFTFSMAISRYDQRKNLEEEEANAIGTEYARADLLPTAEAARVRALLRDYLDQRVAFYTIRSGEKLRQVNARTMQLQSELWSAVVAAVETTTKLPPVTLAVEGMNDVLNSQGYAQAAAWNRIPPAAWILMWSIALVSHVLIGYGSSNFAAQRAVLIVLPLVLSISFFLIADIDSPRGGVIRVAPVNLLSLADSMGPR